MRLNVRLSKSSTRLLMRLVMRFLAILGAVGDAMALVAILWRFGICVALRAQR